MKLLEKEKGWAKQFKCTGKGNKDGGCGAKLLIEESDLFQTYSSDMNGDQEWFITFKCIECGVLTDIEAPFNARLLPTYEEWKKRQ